MKDSTSKEKKNYTQGLQLAARVVLSVGLLFSCGLERLFTAAATTESQATRVLEPTYQEVGNHSMLSEREGNNSPSSGDAHQAVSCYERALATFEQVYEKDPNHPEIAATLNNLGNAWRDLGDTRKAVDYYKRALAIYEQAYDVTWIGFLSNLWQVLANASQIFSFFERAKKTPNHPAIASTLNNLGNAWRDLGHARQAVSL